MTRITADWLSNTATQRIFSLLTDAGYQAFLVGGCVRNALINEPVKDIDISTNAKPDQVISLAKSASIKAVPTGVEHGTVTLVVSGQPFEITTFRRDVATDGRRATVAFSNNIEDDARRRDFTINALYADASGKVFDPLGGLPDLRDRRIRFIEDADQRIQEDYLRSLRFFRFFAWYGDPDGGIDADAIDAIARNIGGLRQLSRERVGGEVLRLLAAPNPAPSVASMRSTGVLAAILPGAIDSSLAPLVHLEDEAGIKPQALRRLAAMGGDDVAKRLRLSRKEAEALAHLRNADLVAAPAALGYKMGAEAAIDALLIHGALLGSAPAAEALEGVARGAKKVFPITASDLMPDLEGKVLGERLKALEHNWIASDFSLSKTDLLKSL